MTKDRYLGDGVYARYESGMIKLWTDREDGEHYIFLEPEVCQNFKSFSDEVWGVKT